MSKLKLSYDDLPEDDQKLLAEVYGSQPRGGYSSNKIKYVRPLSSREQWFFSKDNFMSANVMTQTIYKLKGTLLPTSFTRAIRELDAREDIIRLNYCDMGGGKVLAVVFHERKNAEVINYHHVVHLNDSALDSEIFRTAESERRQPMDLLHSLLARFVIFHTASDEYAVLVTAAQIVMDRLDIRDVFRGAAGMEPLARKEMPMIPRSARMEMQIREYWQKLLSPPPVPVALPGKVPKKGNTYQHGVCRFVISAEKTAEFLQEIDGNRMVFMSALATTWGLLLQGLQNIKDLCLCLTIPKRNAAGNHLWQPFEMVPFRLSCAEEDRVAQILERQVKQLAVSTPYASIDWKGFGEILGQVQKPFDHFLDFCDFVGEAGLYSRMPAVPGGRIVTQHSWDARSMKLSLYFRYDKGNVYISFLYDKGAFASGACDQLAEKYASLVEFVLRERRATFAEIRDRLAGKIGVSAEMRAKEEETKAAELQHVISSVSLLQAPDEGILWSLMKKARIITYYEGDRVRNMTEDMLFVVEGKLARSIKDDAGWYHTLDIVKKGAWLNEAVLFEGRKSVLSAEVLTDSARILSIPRGAMKKILAQHPALWENIAGYVVSRMETYQKLWSMS